MWHTWERRGTYRVLVGKPAEKRPLARSRHRLKDNIKMDPEEMSGEGLDWIYLAEDRDEW
jgi:hypothetical protein